MPHAVSTSPESYEQRPPEHRSGAESKTSGRGPLVGLRRRLHGAVHGGRARKGWPHAARAWVVVLSVAIETEVADPPPDHPRRLRAPQEIRGREIPTQDRRPRRRLRTEDLRLLCGELLVSEHALLVEGRKSLQLFDGVQRQTGGWGRWGRRRLRRCLRRWRCLWLLRSLGCGCLLGLALLPASHPARHRGSPCRRRLPWWSPRAISGRRRNMMISPFAVT